MIKRTETVAKIIEVPTTKLIPLSSLPKTKLPAFIEPQLCTLTNSAPTTADWIHEIKLDGYRTECRKDGSKVQMLTRSGLDWTHKYSEIAADCKKLKSTSCILDGEVVWQDKNGITHFYGLQNALEENSTANLSYYVFDLLFLDGKNLRDVPLLQRKYLLKNLLEKSDAEKIIFSEHQTVHGPSLHSSACKLGLEGIISKKAGGTYFSGRSQDWLKVKCTHTQEFIVCGYTLQDNGVSLAALIMGEYDSTGKLSYIGHVGTGFNSKNSTTLIKKMKKLRTTTPTFALRVPGAKSINWVKPHLVVNVTFGAWTEDHILRHAAYKGLREDEKANEIVREKIIKTKSPAQSLHPKLTHPDKIIFVKDKIKKIDIANYYTAIEKLILPHIKNRPLSLLRCPSGQGKACFFQKHLDDDNSSIISVQSMEELQHLVQLNALELHAWNCQVNSIDNPNLIVFDLDPDPGVGWKKVKKAAVDLKDILDQLHLESFLKISGNKGLHLHVPVMPKYSWDEIKNFSKSVCMQLVEQDPEIYTVNILKKNRKIMQTLHMPLKNKVLHYVKKSRIPLWVWITVITLLVIRLILPHAALRGINWALATKLTMYDGRLNDLDLILYRGAYQLQGLEIKKKSSTLPPILEVSQIDLSLAWRTLFRGEVTGDIHLVNAQIRIIDNDEKEKKQYGNDEPSWKEALGVLVPITIQSLKVENSAVYFSNNDLSKTKPIQIEKINLTARDLRSRSDGNEDALSPIEGSAILQDHAPLKVQGKLDALAKELRFDLNASLLNFHPKNINPMLLKYLPLDLTKGEISVYSEVAASQGDMIGYVKVFLKEIDVIAPKQDLKSGKHLFMELGTAFANWFLKNNEDQTVAALIPFARRQGKFDIDTSEAFWSAIKNKREELKRGFDNSISLKNLEDKKDTVSRF